VKYIFLILIVFFSGCSFKDYNHKKTNIVVIRSPRLKFNDIGYLQNNESSVKLDLYNAGVALESITINHLVCFKKGCITKSSFNKEYLNKAYPDDILKNILLKKPIFNGKNIVKKDNGFFQKIKSKDYDITYKVSNKEIYFKDKKNRIIFKLKEIDG
jgi:hypothetical protein